MQAIKARGGSATIREIVNDVIASEGFSEEMQAIRHTRGNIPKLEYRLAWARSWLKGIGAVDNSVRGVWTITEAGKKAQEAELPALIADSRRIDRRERRALDPVDVDFEDANEKGDLESSWRDELHAKLLEMAPDGFERLAQRVLREAGFVNVSVTGRSGDGGIDGVGVYRISLVSFPTVFQCKRYKGSVGAGVVRDFRGAMVGRGDKGLLITTGSFTREAEGEATRDGAPPIELIDGDRLCDLLKEYELGVTTRQRIEEDVEVTEAFFDAI